MPQVARRSRRTDAADTARLESIAQSIKGTFQTVEDMTQSFIREAILQGVLVPGQRLNLDAIAATLGVSRMPVRASLRQLESEGLVQIYPHRGATVSVLRPAEIKEIYELRILIECYLLELALPRLTDEVLASLQQTAETLEASDDLSERLEMRKRFYEELYGLADRPRALAEAKHLRGAVGSYLLLRRVEEPGGHPGLLQHLSNRNVDAAKEWLASHLGKVSLELQHLVAADGGEDGVRGEGQG
jgi:DNA-binding GntR family transcriptional regulator